MNIEQIKSCTQLNEEIFAEAARTREATYALLDHIAKIAKPHDGEAKILHFLSRVALKTWVDGDLRVTIQLIDSFVCRFKLMRHAGGDLYEIIKRFDASVSFTELRRVGDDAKNILPFRLQKVDELKQLTFEAPLTLRRSTIPPPEFEQAVVLVEERAAWLQPPETPEDLAHALIAPETRIFNPEAPTSVQIARIPLAKMPVFAISDHGTPPDAQNGQPRFKPHPAKPEVAKALEKARKRTIGYGNISAPQIPTKPTPPESIPPLPLVMGDACGFTEEEAITSKGDQRIDPPTIPPPSIKIEAKEEGVDDIDDGWDD